MSPKALMLLGGFGGLGLLIAFSFTPVGGSATAVFALGALFGKGYGIWEERTRPAPIEDGEARDPGCGNNVDNGR